MSSLRLHANANLAGGKSPISAIGNKGCAATLPRLPANRIVAFRPIHEYVHNLRAWEREKQKVCGIGFPRQGKTDNKMMTRSLSENTRLANNGTIL